MDRDVYSEKYRQKLIELVKAAGQDVIDRAEDLVGNGDLICDFDIWLRFPKNGVPTIELTRSYLSKNSINIITKGGNES